MTIKQQRLARFVRVWQASSSVAEVAALLGLAPSTVSSRASRLRAEGVDLKRMPAGRPAVVIDFAALAAIVDGRK